jgi:hypothetical protein
MGSIRSLRAGPDTQPAPVLQGRQDARPEAARAAPPAPGSAAGPSLVGQEPPGVPVSGALALPSAAPHLDLDAAAAFAAQAVDHRVEFGLRDRRHALGARNAHGVARVASRLPSPACRSAPVLRRAAGTRHGNGRSIPAGC